MRIYQQNVLLFQATVRGMDTIANFSQSLLNINIDKFYVAGASKVKYEI